MNVTRGVNVAKEPASQLPTKQCDAVCGLVGVQNLAVQAKNESSVAKYNSFKFAGAWVNNVSLKHPFDDNNVPWTCPSLLLVS